MFGQDEYDHKTSNISAHSFLFHNSIKVCFVAMMMVTHSDEMHTFTLIYILLTYKPELIFPPFQPLNLCDIEGVSGISVSKEDEVNRRVDIQIKDPAKEV